MQGTHQWVNFMDHIDWATECPNTWLNMIFGCVCDGVSKWDSFDWCTEWIGCRLQCGWTSCNPWRAWIKQKRWEVVASTLCLTIWAGTTVSSYSGRLILRPSNADWALYRGLNGAQASEPPQQRSWVSSLYTRDHGTCQPSTSVWAKLTKSLFPYTQKWFSFSNELWGKETRHKSVFCGIPLPWKENR